MMTSRWQANQVAIVLTVAYWIGTIPLAMTLVNYSWPWFWIGWFAAVLFFAIPLTALLWILLPLSRCARFKISEGSLRGQDSEAPERPAYFGVIADDPERMTYYLRNTLEGL